MPQKKAKGAEQDLPRILLTAKNALRLNRLFFQNAVSPFRFFPILCLHGRQFACPQNNKNSLHQKSACRKELFQQAPVLIQYSSCRSFHRGKAFLQIRNDVIDMFRADGKADGVRFDTLIQQFLFAQLRVRRRGRMDHEGFYIRHIRKQRKISKLSMNRCVSSLPPLISKVKMDAPPFGKYLSYSAWSG